MKVLMKFVIYL